MGFTAGRIAVALAFAIVASSACAFDAKQITLKVGYGAGGTYDLSSRLMARYLGKYLPGEPEIIVQNVPGGGSLKLSMLMLGSEPADGSVIASISSAMAFAPRLDPANVNFDPSAIVWLGSLSGEPSYCATTKASGIDTMEEFLGGDFLIGASARNSLTYQLAAIVKSGLNANFQIVTGFSGVAEIELAMERGELAGHCSTSIPDLERQGRLEEVTVIGHFGSATNPYHGVPRFSSLIADPIVRQGAEYIETARDINYPLMTPAGTPEETVALLREAYAAVTSDPEFVAEAKRLGEFVLSPKTGVEMTAIVSRQLQADEAVINAALELLR